VTLSHVRVPRRYGNPRSRGISRPRSWRNRHPWTRQIWSNELRGWKLTWPIGLENRKTPIDHDRWITVNFFFTEITPDLWSSDPVNGFTGKRAFVWEMVLYPKLITIETRQDKERWLFLERQTWDACAKRRDSSWGEKWVVLLDTLHSYFEW